jgi:hypothetical protein
MGAWPTGPRATESVTSRLICRGDLRVTTAQPRELTGLGRHSEGIAVDKDVNRAPLGGPVEAVRFVSLVTATNAPPTARSLLWRIS